MLILSASANFSSAQTRTVNTDTDGLVCDIDAAVDWCKSESLRPEEGIWLYPEDNVTVLVRRLPDTGNNVISEAEITIIDSPDCRLKPGERIGTISALAQKGKYEIKLYSRKTQKVLAGLQKGLAQIENDGYSMTFSFPKIKFRWRLNSIIPNFWKTVSVSYKSPFENVKSGMVKIFPSYDGNGNSTLNPIYL